MARCWAGRRRQLYPLNDRDLSVLKTQVRGSLVAFRRRHGIRELVLSKDAVSWRGCGKRTPPCPFNLYVNRLGLNTAPCCREHMKELSHHVASCLSEMGDGQAGEESRAEQPKSGVVTVLRQEFDRSRGRSGGRSEGDCRGRDDVRHGDDEADRDGQGGTVEAIGRQRHQHHRKGRQNPRRQGCRQAGRIPVPWISQEADEG